MKKLIVLLAATISLSACSNSYPILKEYGLSKKHILNDYLTSKSIVSNERIIDKEIYMKPFILMKEYKELLDFISYLEDRNAAYEPEYEEDQNSSLISSIEQLKTIKETGFEKYNFLIPGETRIASYNSGCYELENLYYKDNTLYFHEIKVKEMVKSYSLMLYSCRTFFIGKSAEFDKIEFLTTDKSK